MDPACENLINEFESYIWRDEKDVPVKEHDHALDALRYLHDMLSEPSGAFKGIRDTQPHHHAEQPVEVSIIGSDFFG